MSKKKSLASAPTRTRYGRTNPERVENELWEKAIQEDWSGYHVAQHVAIKRNVDPRRQDFSHSSYRDSTPGPCWSWQRFGRTSTPLPDGRAIHVAGEHEDSYDADFCIYNDVIVESPGGRREFYLYPKDVLPPTDFHSATLIGDEIVLIGSLGYRDLRRPGETQVLKLNTRTLRVEQIATAGEGPGWISRHTAEKLSETKILVIGGSVQTLNGYEPNTGVFELDLATMVWRRREHADYAVFPISQEIYRRNKNPRYGTANPERSDNPFWLEMARRRWSASRARLHFGDFAPPEPKLELPENAPDPSEIGTPESNAWMARLSAAIDRDKLVRTVDDVVWTVVREDALTMVLPDGRSLLIGGEVRNYGDEYADPCNYNDVVVTHPDGAIDILIYPKAVFPHLSSVVGALHEPDIYLFGIIDGERHPDRAWRLAVLRLDTRSYEIAELPVAAPSARLNIYQGGVLHDGNDLIFPIVRQRNSDPELGVAFDLETLAWSAPFPHPHAGGD
jgi:hypothetical protein